MSTAQEVEADAATTALVVADTTIDRLTIESAVGQDVHDARALHEAVHRLGRHGGFATSIANRATNRCYGRPTR